MIGTLAYFGILSPSKILPNRCNFGAEFQCLDYQIGGATATPTPHVFKLRLKNNVGEPIDVTAIKLGSESVTAYSCTLVGSLPTGWKAGEVKALDWNLCNSGAAGIIAGEKGKVLVTIRYNTVASGSAYAKDVKGEVFSTVI